MADWDNYRRCGTCGSRYNAKEYGNYFYCSFGCSADAYAKNNPKVHAYDEDGYYLGMYHKNDPYLNGLRTEDEE